MAVCYRRVSIFQGFGLIAYWKWHDSRSERSLFGIHELSGFSIARRLKVIIIYCCCCIIANIGYFITCTTLTTATITTTSDQTSATGIVFIFCRRRRCRCCCCCCINFFKSDMLAIGIGIDFILANSIAHRFRRIWHNNFNS